MSYRAAWLVVALSGFLTVVAGAFGAHGLEQRLAPEMLDSFETAVRYQAWHTLAALGVLAWRQSMPLGGQGLTLGLWAAGTVCFSGSIYGLVLAQLSLLGPVTPFGGGLLMAGWLSLGWSAWQAQSPSGRL
ncbi:DUF423 domain-containing protein [Aidingimonas halophila]|uniref:Uncharacterized membrane protein YgdD, TMEM256/DUF423 family n=1 Tax=Aidingimonas halophila TaxID=574349 RepID=A0A1H2Y1V0_9GAMM|nr:DUF423 domain-containing protein [Aidingimonas halophila]GHC34337.1 membrane protein [Aidingimonas halophila]SDW99116.1 Uncharacterized membrane protein YgdD, TMEM256/DUF423 family [Aidingimonas halophila]